MRLRFRSSDYRIRHDSSRSLCLQRDGGRGCGSPGSSVGTRPNHGPLMRPQRKEPIQINETRYWKFEGEPRNHSGATQWRAFPSRLEERQSSRRSSRLRFSQRYSTRVLALHRNGQLCSELSLPPLHLAPVCGNCGWVALRYVRWCAGLGSLHRRTACR
jgi:hypothetical protein